MIANTCQRCHRPLEDAVVCSRCWEAVTKDLAEIPALVSELDVTLAKQAVTGESFGRSSSTHPLPVNAAALDASVALDEVLAGWVRLFAQDPPPDPQNPAQDRPVRPSGYLRTPQSPTAAHRAVWLLGRSERIRHHDQAAYFLRAIGHAVGRIRLVVDLPPSRVYAGPCDDCRNDLYVTAGEAFVVCLCGARYDVHERRAWLRDSVEDMLAAAPEISRALTTLDVPVTEASIRGYAHRGQLSAKNTNHKGQPMYRVGDVLDLVVATAQRRAGRR